MDIGDFVALLTRHLRFPGRYSFLQRFFSSDRFRRQNAQDRWFNTYDGDLKMLCNLGSYIEWNVFFRGYYDAGLSAALKKLVRFGMTTLDVGANVGAYTLLMAKCVGRQGKVFAFEPNPEVYNRLSRNVLANDFQNIVVLCSKALSQTQGGSILHVPENSYSHRGIGSMYLYANVPTEPIEISVSTVDEEVIKQSAAMVDLIKIDTEGNDVLVLEGAKNTISQHRPIIIFEANYVAHQKAGLRIESAFENLKSLRYDFFRVGRFGALRKLDKNRTLPDTNIICIPHTK